jgi:hypothetical protein
LDGISNPWALIKLLHEKYLPLNHKHLFNVAQSLHQLKLSQGEELMSYFNQLNVIIKELTLHTNFHQPSGTIVMVMLMGLPVDY